MTELATSDGNGNYYIPWSPISANVREAKAEALEDAAKALDRIGDGELDEVLTSNWLRKRAANIRKYEAR